jgi:NAD(P)-dependent dehydrogenase (short-subunit alcohol dehydrogenase family)
MNVIDSFRLEGRIAVVTGGAGLSGRQRRSLAEAGAKSFIASRDIEALRQQASSFRAAGLDGTALPLDQADPQSVQQLLLSSSRAGVPGDIGHGAQT